MVATMFTASPYSPILMRPLFSEVGLSSKKVPDIILVETIKTGLGVVFGE
jgi:hypothetical protein